MEAAAGSLWFLDVCLYARFAKWRDDGILEAAFHALPKDADMENLSIDSTKVHESANGGKKTADKVVGRTRAGQGNSIYFFQLALQSNNQRSSPYTCHPALDAGARYSSFY